MDPKETDMSLQELEDLFKDLEESESEPTESETNPPATQPASKVTPENVETTKAFAKRLSEKTAVAVAEERDRIAKELGYESYDQLQKRREEKMLQDKGLDPEEVSPIVEELVKKRLDSDPRMKELELLKSKQLNEFAQKELKDLRDLTDGDITTMEQIPTDVIELWKQTGSLKKAYISLHGEELIIKNKNKSKRGTMSHLQSNSSTAPSPTDMRLLTDEEKNVWKLFNRNLTDEELNKKTIKK